MTERITHDGTRWSNAAEDRVEIRPYDAGWPQQFEQEAASIRAELPGTLCGSIEHIGSTAVPGLAAKPIIDIVLAVPERVRWPELIAPLQRLGYVHWAGNPDTSRMFFVKGMPPFGAGRTHHVHVLAPEALVPIRQFRDFLATHAEEARRYEALKRRLAGQFDQDRDAYTAAKAAFVTEALARASGERACS